MLKVVLLGAVILFAFFPEQSLRAIVKLENLGAGANNFLARVLGGFERSPQKVTDRGVKLLRVLGVLLALCILFVKLGF